MTRQTEIGSLQAWILAARPRTLPAAVAPVLVGIGLAIADGVFAPLPALAALVGALLLQVGVNLANDYFDHIRGIDIPERLGPPRVAASGLIPLRDLRLGMAAVFGITALIGVYLIAVAGWPILAIGAASILAALAYSGGPFPLASHGLGDLFVFLFFGLAAVCGTYYAQARTLDAYVVLAAFPPGLLITAILVVNNLRDIDTDRKTGKRTLAVILGRRGARVEYTTLLAASYLIPAALWAVGQYRIPALLPMLSLPLTAPLIRLIWRESGRALNRGLADTARLALIFSLLFAVGLALS
ncbi:MAG: 1,4-dihydroxy-2-naphthoate polyprenyltransferase [Anaerolineae bacterium]